GVVSSGWTNSGGAYVGLTNPLTSFRDADGDGRGDANDSTLTCDGSVPPGFVLDASDCNDHSSGTWAAPALVQSLSVGRIAGGARIGWQSQSAAAGSSTTYDDVRGDISDLRPDAGFTSSSCLVADQAGPPYDDLKADPVA